MIVAGYSPKGTQIGVSSSLAAMAVWQYFAKEQSILIVQAGFWSNLEETLLGINIWKRKEFFETKGIDELLRAATADSLNESSIKRAVLSLKQEQRVFDLLPATTKKSKNLYERSLEQFLPALLLKLEKQYDLVYVDFGAEQEKLWNQMQNLFAQIYIFLPQNRWVLEQWNRKEIQIERQKIILARYESDSIWNYSNLKWRYPRIGKYLVGGIPFDIRYMDSWSKGKAFEYLTIQCDMEKREKNSVMHSVKEIYKKIEKDKWSGSGEKQKAV